MNNEFQGKTFSAPLQRCSLITEVLVRDSLLDNNSRVLDLGCGTGVQLFDIAKKINLSELVGIDISKENIRIATNKLAEQSNSKKISFHAIDYMEFDSLPFDIIISDSTLHNIPVSTDSLFSKIQSDLTEGGFLVASMPYNCFYNQIIWSIRRILKKIRSPFTDSLILSLSRLFHRKNYTDDMLKERIHYMYLLPFRYFNNFFHSKFESSHNMKLVKKIHLAHTSFAQPKHMLCIYKKL